ncbi:hypothetical protein ACPUER_34555 [Burkholderia sp. DN3021]|uniref:hypothetical protein n=1 Tax=Burkholderia sp. DN3021 TaxID=3410137 RepID=UPI003C7A25C0
MIDLPRTLDDIMNVDACSALSLQGATLRAPELLNWFYDTHVVAKDRLGRHRCPGCGVSQSGKQGGYDNLTQVSLGSTGEQR